LLGIHKIPGLMIRGAVTGEKEKKEGKGKKRKRAE
jgi:hypothetical protein